MLILSIYLLDLISVVWLVRVALTFSGVDILSPIPALLLEWKRFLITILVAIWIALLRFSFFYTQTINVSTFKAYNDSFYPIYFLIVILATISLLRGDAFYDPDEEHSKFPKYTSSYIGLFNCVLITSNLIF